MFDFIHRSRSLRNGLPAHVPEPLAQEGNGQGASSFEEGPSKVTEQGVVHAGSRKNEGSSCFPSDDEEPPPSAVDSPITLTPDDGLTSTGQSQTGFAFPFSNNHPSDSSLHRLTMIAQRPSTSSGAANPSAFFKTPSPSFSDFNNKRMSKDDSYIRPRGAATKQPGIKAYHIPIRGNPPSPKGSGSDERSSRPVIPVRTLTPESLHDNSGVINIGMAIGSPSYPPPPGFNDSQSGGLAITRTESPEFMLPGQMPQPSPAPSAMTAAPSASNGSPQQNKTSRWKLFSRSKSKRGKTDQAKAPTTETPLPPAVPSHTDETPGLDRSNTERKAARYKPIIIRSQTAPMTTDTPKKKKGSQAPAQWPMPTVNENWGQSQLDVSNALPGANGFSEQRVDSPMLNVEIPDVTLERYSVMFGGLLQSQRNSSSLLSRRQATLDKLKSISDKVALEEEAKGLRPPPKMSSPTRGRASPNLSLFPTPTSAASPVPGSPRGRSMTMPTGLPSHPKQRLRESQANLSNANGTPPALTIDRDTPAQRPVGKRHATAGARMPPGSTTESPASTVFSPQQSEMSSPGTPESGARALHIKEHLRPTIYEPEWDMVPASKSQSTLVLPPRKQSLPHNRSPLMLASSSPAPSDAATTPVAAGTSTVAPNDSDALKTAVEVSIARQISVSQQQRRMLGSNIKTVNSSSNAPEEGRGRRMRVPRSDRDGSPAHSPSGKRSPVSTVLADNERLAATKMATPKLITTPEPYNNSPLAQHRKSERIVLEGV